MKCKLTIATLFANFFVVPAAFASELSLNFSGDTFEAQYLANNISQNVNFSASFLFADEDGGEGGDVYDLGINTSSKLRTFDNVYGGLGAKLHYIDLSVDDYQALSVGGFLDIGLDFAVPGLSFLTEVYVAPSVTTSGDIDGYREFSLGVKYKAFENAAVYGGFRDVEVEFDNGGTYEIDDSFHLGIKLSF